MNPVPAEPGRPIGMDSIERPIGRVRGTRDWLPHDFARLAALERLLLDQFRRAGYEPMRTPILEFAVLHERKSGAGIVARLFEISGGGPAEICLRPELTASIVRAYAANSPRSASNSSGLGGRPPMPRSSGWPTGPYARWGLPMRRSGSATSA